MKEMTKEAFELNKKLLEMEKKLEDLRHKYRIKELEFVRETNRVSHQDELTRMRIKTAEIRKTFKEKTEAQRYGRQY